MSIIETKNTKDILNKESPWGAPVPTGIIRVWPTRILSDFRLLAFRISAIGMPYCCAILDSIFPADRPWHSSCYDQAHA